MRVKKSTWKFPFNNIHKYNYKVGEFLLTTYNRNLTLTSRMLNKQVRCHKGKVVGKLLIEEKHLGHKLGEFFITKILGERIAYRKRQKEILRRSRSRKKKKNKQ